MEVAALVLAALASSATAAPAAWTQRTPTTIRSAIASRGFLLGRWHCAFTVGRDGGVYETTWTRILDGLWLKQTYDQARQPNAFPFKAEYVVGYDQLRKQWIRFGAMTTGQYFAIRMVDTGAGGWRWKYASFFPRRKPAAPGFDARFTRKTDTLYTIDGPTYPNESGDLVTEHHVCRKV
jgi:hypothetical protein